MIGKNVVFIGKLSFLMYGEKASFRYYVSWLVTSQLSLREKSVLLRPIQRKTDKKLDIGEIVGVDFQSYRVVSTYISIYLCRARCWDFRLKCVAYLAAFCSFSVRFVLNQIKNNFWAATSVELVSSDPVNPICSYNLFL